MKSFLLFFAITFIFALQSCNSTTEKIENKTEDLSQFKDEKEIDERMSSIDNQTDLSLVQSLAFNDNAGSQAQAVAYLDKNENELKIEETYLDVKSGNYGTKTFYIDNGKKFASKFVYFENDSKKPQFIERVSFYDDKSKVIYTKERQADFEIDLETLPFQSVKAQDLPIDRTMRIMNMEGEFETTFQGFVQDANLTYLLAGGKADDAFVTSLIVQFEDVNIKKLMKDEKGMLGTPLDLQYQSAVDENDMKFQILLAVKIKE